MNADLERTLDELGPEYRAIVARLRGAYGAAGMAEAEAGRGRPDHGERGVGEWSVGGEGAAETLGSREGAAETLGSRKGAAETLGSRTKHTAQSTLHKARSTGRWWRIAAAIAVAVGLAVVLWPRKDAARVYTVRASEAALEYRLAEMRNDEAVKELIRTQRPDGSWGTEFLTRRNAEALRLVKSEEARIAYKKARHNLRCRARTP